MAEFRNVNLQSCKPASSLQQLLEDINFQRTKELRQLLKDDGGFIVLQGTTYWTDLFVRHFLFQSKAEQSIDCDDLLFFVRKKHVRTSSRSNPKYETEIEVFRKDSRKLPIGDPDVDWEETVYLNLIIHQFEYTLTLAICTRTSPKELQILKRHSQKVYASPSKRKMDTKGECEEITFPHICFMVDNFDEVFQEIVVRDGEMVCVELVASDRDGSVQGVIFLGSIRYDALKKTYDARQSYSLSSKVAQRMSFGLFNSVGTNRCEFVRMKGPQGKGHAEMAVTKPKDDNSGIETPTQSEPGFCLTEDMMDSEWDNEENFYRHQRRLSDPSSNLNNFTRLGWRQKNSSDTHNSKARSENEGLDCLANEISEIEAGDLRDERPAPQIFESCSSSTTSQLNDSTQKSSKCCTNCFTAKRYDSLQMTAEIYCPTCDTNSPACLNTMTKNSVFGSRNLLNVESEIEMVSSNRKCDREGKLLFASKNIQHTSKKSLIKKTYKRNEDYEYGNDLAASIENDLEENFATTKTQLNFDVNTNKLIRVNGKEEFPVRSDGRKAIRNKNLVISLENNKVFNEFMRQKTNQWNTRVPKSPKLESSNENISIMEINGNVSKNSQLYIKKQPSTLPKMKKRLNHSDIYRMRMKLNVPTKTTDDGTKIFYWCDLSDKLIKELDDGTFNPLWTTKGFTQTFHFWKENRKLNSTPLNSFLTYVQLPWWSIAKDLLDHRETPILTF